MSEKLKQAKARGAEIEVLAKKVDVTGLSALADQLQSLIREQQIYQAAQTKMMTDAIDRMVDAINEKEVRSETDLSGLVKAVMSLKPEPLAPSIPFDYSLDFERDQRGLMKPGSVKLIAIPKVLN